MRVKHPLFEKGYAQVQIPSHMIDSIWKKDDELLIKFATGQILEFKPIEHQEEVRE